MLKRIFKKNNKKMETLYDKYVQEYGRSSVEQLTGQEFVNFCHKNGKVSKYILLSCIE